VAPSGSLALSCWDVAVGTGQTCSAPAPYAVPGDYPYTEQFSGGTGSGAITGSDIYDGNTNTSMGSAGFIDDYLRNSPRGSRFPPDVDTLSFIYCGDATFS